MTFEQLIEKIRGISLQEIRSMEAHYVEVVAAKSEMARIAPALESFFGLPVKPEGKDPSADAKKAAEPYGGIWKNQTMYFLQNGEGKSAAMLWPWGDGETVTLKIFRS